MDTKASGKRIQSYLDFMNYMEYPMVLFEKDSGRVLKVNYEAQMIIGKDVSKITVTQDSSHVEEIVAEKLEVSKSILWYRIILQADDRSYYVSGIVNTFEENGTEYYAVMFESRGDLQRGSVTLERIINRSGFVAIYMFCDTSKNDQWKVRYISQNIKKYGYTSEQFYRGLIYIQDMMTPEDYKKVYAQLVDKAKHGETKFSIYTYWVSEDRQSHYVRMDMHYDRDQYGKIIGVDGLVYDLSREQKESEENQYLKQAIQKSKSIVLVKRYCGGKRSLRFISSNAVMLGCNVNALMRGDRLTEDYIHPKDREEVLDCVYKTIASQDTDVVLKYRMVGDDGACRYVRNEITITHLSDNEADVQFFITDITEEREYEETLLKQQRNYEEEIDFIMKGYEKSDESFDVVEVLKDDFMEDFIEAFVTVTGLYSVLIDLNGKFITKPAGGMEHIGEFYDLFERPFYKELYMKLNAQLLETHEPVVMEMNDGNPNSRIAGAPIVLDDRHIATWIICGFSREERDKLLNIYRAHYYLTEHISAYLYNEAVVDREIRRSRLNEHRLEKQLERQNIISDLLGGFKEANAGTLDMVMESAGKYLDVDRICCYRLSVKDKTFKCVLEWDGKNMEKNANLNLQWPQSGNIEHEERIQENDYLVISDQQCSMQVQQFMVKGGLKSSLVVPIFRNGQLQGFISCGEYKRHRVWKQSEIQFMQNIRDIVYAIDSIVSNRGGLRMMTKGMISAIDYCPVIMYVWDSDSDEILYANKSAMDAFGTSLVGYKSSNIVKSMMVQYEHNPAMRKHFVYNKNISKWECYIKQLDKTMQVQEIRTEWYEHKNAKLVMISDI